MTRSNIVDQIVASSTLTEADQQAIAAQVWKYSTNADVGANSYGTLTQGIDSDLGVLDTKVDKTLTKGEFLALK